MTFFFFFVGKLFFFNFIFAKLNTGDIYVACCNTYYTTVIMCYFSGLEINKAIRDNFCEKLPYVASHKKI